MKQFTDLGLEVPLTELDVRVKVDANDYATPAELATQATDYATAVNACLGNALCPGVTICKYFHGPLYLGQHKPGALAHFPSFPGQFYDPISWIPDVFPGEGAATPYNASYGAKPAYYSMQTALSSATGKTQYKPKKH